MIVYDPTVDSGGMLIQARDCLRERGADASELALYGQEEMGITWSICKKNKELVRVAKLQSQKLGLMQDLTGKVPVKVNEAEVVDG